MFFAIISTLVNLFVQYISFNLIWNNEKLFNGIILGTISGFIIKYILDKIYIFQYSSSNIVNEIRVFSFYSFMSIITTLLFWLTEFLFEYYINIIYSRYIGAIIGLSIGYTIKYFLDKKYVFIND
jgi:putative flippase GtrA|tara:strand:+ start:140 stop:514 length:375 start_codon:yes stop_codon:yes gene_type:complete